MDEAKFEKTGNEDGLDIRDESLENNESSMEDSESAESTRESNQSLGNVTLEIARGTAESEDNAENGENYEDAESIVIAKIRPLVEKYVKNEPNEEWDTGNAIREDDLCSIIHDLCKEISDEKPENGVKSFEEFVDLVERIVGSAKRARRAFDTDMATKLVRLQEYDRESGLEKAMNLYDSLVSGEKSDPEKRPFGGVSNWMEYRRMNGVPDHYVSDDIILYHPDPDFHGTVSSRAMDTALWKASKDLPFEYDERYYRPWNIDTVYRPRGYESSYRPYGYDDGIYRPRSYESSYRPRGYESSYRPYGYESSYRPRGYESSYRPYGYDDDIYRPGEY